MKIISLSTSPLQGGFKINRFCHTKRYDGELADAGDERRSWTMDTDEVKMNLIG